MDRQRHRALAHRLDTALSQAISAGDTEMEVRILARQARLHGVNQYPDVLTGQVPVSGNEPEDADDEQEPAPE